MLVSLAVPIFCLVSLILSYFTTSFAIQNIVFYLSHIHFFIVLSVHYDQTVSFH